MQVAGTVAKGPPTASQSLEPTTSIPDRILIGQRTRRATRVGKHGAAHLSLRSRSGSAPADLPCARTSRWRPWWHSYHSQRPCPA